MKKLMVLFVCGLGLTVANAAAVTWASGVGIKGVDSAAYLPAGDVKMYVFELADQTAFDAFKTDADSISKLDLSKAALSGATTKSSTGITLSDATKYKAGDSIYAAVVVTQLDGANTYFVAQKMTATVDEMDSGVGFSSLAKKVLGGGGADVSWTKMAGGSDVPEPTSAMLLLLGVAGLALRRKQK